MCDVSLTKTAVSPISSFVSFSWLHTRTRSELRKEPVVGLTKSLAALLRVQS